MIIGVTEILTVLVVVALVAGVIPFWTWMIRDCWADDGLEGKARLLWRAVVVAGGPVGAFVYLVSRRRDRVAASRRR